MHFITLTSSSTLLTSIKCVSFFNSEYICTQIRTYHISSSIILLSYISCTIKAEHNASIIINPYLPKRIWVLLIRAEGQQSMWFITYIPLYLLFWKLQLLLSSPIKHQEVQSASNLFNLTCCILDLTASGFAWLLVSNNNIHWDESSNKK